ncbi:prepilin-type N-terminal cleavage/methylation domain-containing protein [Chloroflexota bacterium]
MIRRAGQNGMTLVEVVIASAIAAAITAALAMVIYSLMTATERGNSINTTAHDVQRAVYWISHDARMAGSTDISDGDPAASEVLLSWVDGGGNAHSSHYYLEGIELRRNYDANIMTVAKSITSIEFTVSGDNLNYVIESTAGRFDTSETFSGTVYFRPTA